MSKRKICDNLRLHLTGLDSSLVAVADRGVVPARAKKTVEPGSDRFWGYPPE